MGSSAHSSRNVAARLPTYWLSSPLASVTCFAISARVNCRGTSNFDNDDETTMRILSVWVFEFIKLLGRRRLHPLNAECPICHRVVRLHYNKAGRRHLFAHARAYSRTLYEGSRYGAHYTAKIKCVGSGMLAKFDPRPNESQQFKLPKSLELEG